MRALSSLLILSTLLLAGCESMEDRFSAVPPKTQVFNGDQAIVSGAAVQAFKRLDFLVTRSKGTDLEAVSRIHSSVAFADSRQLTAKVHLSDVGPGKVEVEVGLVEQVVTPLVRQRNPEARARAEEVARELAALSVRLHASLVKAGLRPGLSR